MHLSMKIPSFKLEHYFAQWEFVAPYLLSSSDLETCRLDELLTMADPESLDLWNNLRLGYTEPQGHPLLRAEIAALYIGITTDDILVFSGAQEAIFAFMNVAVNPGDHVIVTWPGYQSLFEVARAIGAEVSPLPLRHDEGWLLSLDSLQKLITPRTRGVVVNFPHSPTGALPDRATFDGLVDICARYGLYLFSDEVYRFMEMNEAERLPAAAEIYPSGVSLGGMAKSFGLAGLRIGWLALHDQALRRRIWSFKDYLTMCNSGPSEILALMALRARKKILDRNRQIIVQNLIHLDRFFADWAGVFEWVRPRGGSIGFPRLIGEEPIEQFAARLVTEEGVMLLPESVFEHAGNHFRIGTGRTSLPEALCRLERFSQRHLRRTDIAKV
jgi:aspartate/methionine/tyrosine aminotransferase